MSEASNIDEHLRHRILGLLHAGRIRAGDRLPSIRQTAKERGIDHRLVAASYRRLAEEGLVEIRPGSGVFVAGSGDGEVQGVATETTAWLAHFLAEAWLRRIPRGRVGELIVRCAEMPMRVACVESNEDHMESIAAEIELDFGLTADRLMIDPATQDAGSIDPDRLADSDLVVSSVFHAEVARDAARHAGLPYVMISYNRAFTEEIERRLHAGSVVAVVADRRYAERGGTFLAVTAHRDRATYVTADEFPASGLDPADPQVLLTRAARRRLGLDDFHLIPAPPTVIPPEAAEEILRHLVGRAIKGAAEVLADPGRGESEPVPSPT